MYLYIYLFAYVIISLKPFSEKAKKNLRQQAYDIFSCEQHLCCYKCNNFYNSYGNSCRRRTGVGEIFFLSRTILARKPSFRIPDRHRI